MREVSPAATFDPVDTLLSMSRWTSHARLNGLRLAIVRLSLRPASMLVLFFVRVFELH